MFDALKSLFGGKPGGSAGKTLDLEAELAPAAGARGRGEAEYSAFADGGRALEIELEDMPAGACDVRIDGVSVLQLAPVAGRAERKLSTRAGDRVPECRESSRVEVYQGGRAALSGTFARD